MIGRRTYSNTVLRDTIMVGNYSSIGSGCYFHDIGDNHLCVINKKCVFTTNWEQPTLKEDIVIGNDVWIAQGVRVLPGVKIGDGAIIGAGAVVSRDVPPFAVIVGNPGKIARFRFSEEQIEKLLQIKWWEWTEEACTHARENMKDIDVFLEKYDK